MASTVAVHREPVWRERSNFIIATAIDSSGTGVSREQLWTRKIDDHHFELCCIPFFVYDLALGDVIETDDEFIMKRVSSRSGRYVFRLWFGQATVPTRIVSEKLESLGALLEWSSPKLLAVDARDKAHAQELSDYMVQDYLDSGFSFESGKTD